MHAAGIHRVSISFFFKNNRRVLSMLVLIYGLCVFGVVLVLRLVTDLHKATLRSHRQFCKPGCTHGRVSYKSCCLERLLNAEGDEGYKVIVGEM
jgi:hypothetical protein